MGKRCGEHTHNIGDQSQELKLSSNNYFEEIGLVPQGTFGWDVLELDTLIDPFLAQPLEFVTGHVAQQCKLPGRERIQKKQCGQSFEVGARMRTEKFPPNSQILIVDGLMKYATNESD